MRRIIGLMLFIVAGTALLTSCAKEYTCECDGYSAIVEGTSESDAAAACDQKGASCDLK